MGRQRRADEREEKETLSARAGRSRSRRPRDFFERRGSVAKRRAGREAVKAGPVAVQVVADGGALSARSQRRTARQEEAPQVRERNARNYENARGGLSNPKNLRRRGSTAVGTLTLKISSRILQLSGYYFRFPAVSTQDYARDVSLPTQSAMSRPQYSVTVMVTNILRSYFTTINLHGFSSRYDDRDAVYHRR